MERVWSFGNKEKKGRREKEEEKKKEREKGKKRRRNLGKIGKFPPSNSFVMFLDCL